MAPVPFSRTGSAPGLPVARGQLASLEHALERDRRTLDQLVARQGAAERRAAVLEGEDHELGERLAETEQSRHQLQATRAGTEALHVAAVRRVELAEETLRQAAQEHARSQARADALERALDEARGAAGAELLAGVDGVLGTLLDLVEVDSGWEEAFEAAAGASLAAVVVSGSEPARAALSRLRQGRATGAVLALTGSAAGRALLAGPAVPTGTESIRGHVRPRTGGRQFPGLDGVLDTLLHGSCCATSGWSEAIDLALARLDLLWIVGHAAVADFTRTYQSLTGVNLFNLPYWDLAVSLRPIAGIEDWARTYPDLGRPDVTCETMIRGHGEFVEQALHRWPPA